MTIRCLFLLLAEEKQHPRELKCSVMNDRPTSPLLRLTSARQDKVAIFHANYPHAKLHKAGQHTSSSLMLSVSLSTCTAFTFLEHCRANIMKAATGLHLGCMRGLTLHRTKF